MLEHLVACTSKRNCVAHDFSCVNELNYMIKTVRFSALPKMKGTTRKDKAVL